MAIYSGFTHGNILSFHGYVSYVNVCQKVAPWPRNNKCAHEFIMDFSDIRKKTGIVEEDIAKRLQEHPSWDQGYLEAREPEDMWHPRITSYLALFSHMP